MLPESRAVIDRLREFQRAVRSAVIESRDDPTASQIAREDAGDTIYRIDARIEPLLEDFCRDWSRSKPLTLIGEGVRNPDGREGIRVFPDGFPPDRTSIRLIVDPIDGTRGLMYDKRAAWTLAGVAPNHGEKTRLSDIRFAVMTELPTSKMGFADVFWAERGSGARGERVDLGEGRSRPIEPRPSQAGTIEHGFASTANFFPGTGVPAARLIEFLDRELLGPADPAHARIFDDQYISTAGQFHELAVGHDRFNADLRPVFHRMLDRPAGLCCHPYDCAAMLVAQEAGVILTDETGRTLDAPLDITSNVSWIGYANATLRRRIEPLLLRFLREPWSE